MIDRSTPLQVQGRVGDRMIEMQARRLAAEARDGSPRTHTRTHWLTGELRAALHSSAALVARARHVHARPGPRLAAGHPRA
jgi:hypothetical protein